VVIKHRLLSSTRIADDLDYQITILRDCRANHHMISNGWFSPGQEHL